MTVGEPAIEHVFRTTRAVGKRCGTLADSGDIGHWTKTGGQYLYIHSDPFLRSGMKAIKGLIQPADADI